MTPAQSTIDRVRTALSHLPGVHMQQMFGEYALLYRNKIVAFICNNQLYMKKTAPGMSYVSHVASVPHIPNANNYLLVPSNKLDDSVWLSHFVVTTASAA